MLGRVDPQGSLLETRHMRRHLVTKGSFYERLADHGHELISDEDFAHLYAEGKGRPSVPPSVMVRAMLCATHDRTSDAETSRRTRVDSDWKAAMGVDDWFEGIGATTFSLMRARMVAHDADGALFQKTLERAVGNGDIQTALDRGHRLVPGARGGGGGQHLRAGAQNDGTPGPGLGGQPRRGPGRQSGRRWRRPSPTSTGKTRRPAKTTWASWWNWRPRSWAAPPPIRS